MEKRQQYERSRQVVPAKYSTRSYGLESSQSTDTKQTSQFYKQSPKYYICNSPTHLARDCTIQRFESKKEKKIRRKLTLYIAVVNLRIIHQGRVTKILFPCISATTSTLTPATHVADDDSPQSGTVNIGLVLVTGIIDTGPDITIISGICLRQ